MEAPREVNTPEGSEDEEEAAALQLVEQEDEVDINIHFHCEHCVRMYRCNERSKPGWSCDLELCPNRCGQRFHLCKFEEHRLMCSHERVPCINSGYGCPLWMQRKQLAEHLPMCPASVVICNAEWNRWALGAKEREKVSMGKGLTALYNTTDLDMSLALRDQEMVNEMLNMPRRLRNVMCNKITRRFPALPLTVRGSKHDSSSELPESCKLSRQGTDEDDDGLPPGKERTDDISAFCCVHGILKNICHLCRGDPDAPAYKMGRVWREKVSCKKPGEMEWRQEPYVEKVRKKNCRGQFVYMKYDESEDEEEAEMAGAMKELNLVVDEKGRPIRRTRFKTPPPVPLTSKALTMELPLKHYSRHQPKPGSMFTFQCMQELRRSEFASHYQNCHSEIQEGLDGWIVHRCPLHVIGCPYINNRLHPGAKDGDVRYCREQHAFGILPVLDYEPAPIGGLPRSRSPSVEKTTSPLNQISLRHHHKAMQSIPEHTKTSKNCTKQFFASSVNLTYLPIEVLQRIATFLDGFSLNNLTLTCRLMRDVSLSLINDRGLVITEWVRYIEDGKVRWKEGQKRRFFSKAFEYVDRWGFKTVPHMGNHLQVCPFNKRHTPSSKFTYIPRMKDGKLPQKTLRTVRF